MTVAPPRDEKRSLGPGGSRADGVPRFRDRLDAALAELAERQVPSWSARPPSYRLLRALGLPVAPPLYLRLPGLTLYHALTIGPLIGLLLWLLIWRHDDVELRHLFTSVLQIAFLPSLAAALITRFRAWRLKCTRWDRLGVKR